DDGRLAISTFHPDHFGSYWLNPYFPSIREIDEQRFPTPAQLEQDLTAAGFPQIASRRLGATLVIGRDDALARLRRGPISTFDLLREDEIRSGTEKAERELPDPVSMRLERLVVVGAASHGTATVVRTRSA